MTSKLLPLLLTRPEPASRRVLAAVEAHLGPIRAVISPLMELVPVEAPIVAGPVILTSEMGAKRAADLVSTPGLAFCVGERTASVASELGFEVLVAGGNAASLVDVVRRVAPDTVTHIRGQHTAGDIAGSLNAAGVNCSSVIAYEQRPLSLNPQAKALLKGEDAVVVPLFSPRSVVLFKGAGFGMANVLPVMISAQAAKEWPKPVAPVRSPTMGAMVEQVVDLMRTSTKS